MAGSGMRYTIAAVRPAGAAGEDGLLLPIPGPAPDTIELEARDGTRIRQLTAKEIDVRPSGAASPVLHADGICAQVLVTDARVALACTNYDTGGGWIGGPIALTLNATSRVRAARRSRGTVLVGHVRYPWLRGVYARDARRRAGAELLRLAVEGEEGLLQLDLTLPRGSGATVLAAEILRRAARFRLEHDEDASEAERAELEELAAIGPLLWARGEPLAGHALPTFWPPTSRSAMLGLPETATRPARRQRAPGTAAPAAPVLRQPAPPEDVAVVLRRPAPGADDDVDVTLRSRSERPDEGGRRR